ncbi:MAG: hypothetical protein JKX97_08910, partial [Candidatus Lindowbacteria bacterium]|nr:hypothetical protein [Candidatus Lindowbacteria bacterium]
MSLMPWGKADKSVSAFEANPTCQSALEARTAVDELSQKTSIPGVKSRLEGYVERFERKRNVHFKELIEKEELGDASKLMGECPIPAKGDEELIKLAPLALTKNQQPPSVSTVNPDRLVLELRPAFYEAKFHEVRRYKDNDDGREILESWLRTDATSQPAKVHMIRCLLSANDMAAAALYLSDLVPEKRASLQEEILRDNDLSLSLRTQLFLRMNEKGYVVALLDQMLQENPDDSWALSHRAHISDTSGDSSAARFYYAKLLAQNPSDSAIARRLGELAASNSDFYEAKGSFEKAWKGGDLSAGFSFLDLKMQDEDDNSLEVALSLLSEVNDETFATKLGERLLQLHDPVNATHAFRTGLQFNMAVAEKIIGLTHAYVEKHHEGRLPMLQLLLEVAPVRGYPTDIYRLMQAEDLTREGKNLDARDVLEKLMDTEMKWKALVSLGKISMREGSAAQIALAKKLVLSLPEADKAGRRVWSEMVYTAGTLFEEAGHTAEALAQYEAVIAREYQYRDLE